MLLPCAPPQLLLRGCSGVFALLPGVLVSHMSLLLLGNPGAGALYAAATADGAGIGVPPLGSVTGSAVVTVAFVCTFNLPPLRVEGVFFSAPILSTHSCVHWGPCPQLHSASSHTGWDTAASTLPTITLLGCCHFHSHCQSYGPGCHGLAHTQFAVFESTPENPTGGGGEGCSSILTHSQGSSLLIFRCVDAWIS